MGEAALTLELAGLVPGGDFSVSSDDNLALNDVLLDGQDQGDSLTYDGGEGGIDFMIGADRDTLESLLGQPDSPISSIEVFVTQGGDGATSLTDFQSMGIDVNAQGQVALGEGWVAIGSELDSALSDYVEYSHRTDSGEDVTILVLQTALENGHGHA